MNHRMIALGMVFVLVAFVSASFILLSDEDSGNRQRSTFSPPQNIMEALEKTQNDDVMLTMAASRITAQPTGSCRDGCEIAANLVVTNITNEPVFVQNSTIHSGDVEEGVDAASTVETSVSVREYGLQASQSLGITVFGATEDSGDAFMLVVNYSVGSPDAPERQIMLLLPKRPISKQWTPTTLPQT